MEAVIGETVTLAGSAPGADTIYLFMTGPNLDPSGVPLHNPSLSAAAGQFTTTRVSSAGRWEYAWNTAGLGIDAGSYSVFAVTEPRDRRSLQGATYKILQVTLSRGGITLNEERGSLQVTIAPYGSRVEIDSAYQGETPLGISLPPGGYHLMVTHDGYEPFIMDITVYDGRTTSLVTNLTPILTPEPPETTVPPATEAAGWWAALAGAALLIGYRLRR